MSVTESMDFSMDATSVDRSPKFYSNMVRVTGTIEDICLQFCLRSSAFGQPADDQGKPVDVPEPLMQQCVVYLNPAHAARLHTALGEQLEGIRNKINELNAEMMAKRQESDK